MEPSLALLHISFIPMSDNIISCYSVLRAVTILASRLCLGRLSAGAISSVTREYATLCQIQAPIVAGYSFPASLNHRLE